MEELGLFPLQLVLLPTERIPLHIFEPRYRELIGECLDEERKFGLLLDGTAVGTRAAVMQVLERLPDGRLNIVVEGGARFRIARETSGRSFATALVEPFEDEGDDPPAPAEAEQALALFRQLAEVTESDVELPDADSPMLAFELAARVDFGIGPKQELLELRSARERILRLHELLERATAAVSLEREVRERAARNGKVLPLRPDD